ncbi:MAG: hypothetical protein M1830_009235 [Pleopsidium flavum]|nr:MAG: hypothetical protein M1830_009235 [Pleopsidium flavum]
MNLGFLKNLTEKKTTRDGQTPKRRGPKPDSKPALTRRQELNRQAQRTHRERKEVYVKALEAEVLRLKETFSNTVRERDVVAEENRKLKELLRMHGIAFPGLDSYGNFNGARQGGSPYGDSSTGSTSAGYTMNQSLSPPTTVGQGPTPPAVSDNRAGKELGAGPQPTQYFQQQQGLDHDQIGIDFVLTYAGQQSTASPPHPTNQ